MTKLWRPSRVSSKVCVLSWALRHFSRVPLIPTSKDAADTESHLALGRAGCLSPQNPAQGLAQSRHLVKVMDGWWMAWVLITLHRVTQGGATVT